MNKTGDLLKNNLLIKNANNKNAGSKNFNESQVKCQLCQDRGIIVDQETAVPCICMKEKKAENSFRYARLSGELLNCRFENFNIDYYLYPNVKEKNHYVNAQKALTAAEDFVKSVQDNKNEVGLLLTGPVGSGKTYLAASIANELVKNQQQILFLVVPDLLDELKASFNKQNVSEYDLLDIARTVPILFLDDLGAHNYTEWTRNRIYSILNYRMNEQLPTIITTNLDFEQLDDCLGERTCSRLLQMCRVFRLTVQKDIRLQKYEKRESRK